jgi:hypothetical protein
MGAERTSGLSVIRSGTEGGFGESGGCAKGEVGGACGDEQGLDFLGARLLQVGEG